MANNFCTNCGSKLNPAAKFCGNCGTAVNTAAQSAPAAPAPVPVPQPAPTPQPAAAQQQAPAPGAYKYIIQAQFKKGLISQKPCALVFSEQEVIVALVDNKLMQQHLNQVRESAKGEKFLKRTAAVMKAGYTYSDKYWNMGRNQIISEVSGNFIIANNTVQQVRFTRGTTNHYDDTSSTTPPSLVFKTMGGKFSFNFNGSVDTKTFIPMLQTTFPGRYKGPKR